MSDINKVCPVCSAEYDADTKTCPEDGSKLFRLAKDNTDDRVGQKIDENLTLLGLLGQGGMGSVYRALQHSMGREVAVKLLNKQFSSDVTVVRRFMREAQNASKLSHPNIITVFDFGQTADDELFIVMEMLSGQPLNDIIEEEGALDPERAVSIIAQACDALTEAHDLGMIHRDIKPDNIFVRPGAGRSGEFVTVLDFGIAKAVGPDTEETNLTAVGGVCGTPSYMSPEQASGNELDARSDIYSLGVVLYELLTGTRPFVAENPLQVMMKHVTDTPAGLRYTNPDISVPSALERCVLASLAKSAMDRPQTAAEFKKRLFDALDAEEEDDGAFGFGDGDGFGFDMGVNETAAGIGALDMMLGDDDPGDAGGAMDLLQTGNTDEVGVAVAAGVIGSAPTEAAAPMVAAPPTPEPAAGTPQAVETGLGLSSAAAETRSAPESKASRGPLMAFAALVIAGVGVAAFMGTTGGDTPSAAKETSTAEAPDNAGLASVEKDAPAPAPQPKTQPRPASEAAPTDPPTDAPTDPPTDAPTDALDEQVEPPPAATQPKPALATRAVELTSDQDGAEVYRDGIKIGTTPLMVEVAAAATVTFVLKTAGKPDVTLLSAPGKPLETRVARPAPAPAPVAPKNKRVRPKKKKSWTGHVVD